MYCACDIKPIRAASASRAGAALFVLYGLYLGVRAFDNIPKGKHRVKAESHRARNNAKVLVRSLKHSDQEHAGGILRSMRKTAFRIYKWENKWENKNTARRVITIPG